MLVTALGIVQVISWGTLFYAIGVLGAPMRAELGVSELFLISCFTAGLVMSALPAKRSGQMVDRLGGRVVLSAGSALGGLAMALLGARPERRGDGGRMARRGRGHGGVPLRSRVRHALAACGRQLPPLGRVSHVWGGFASTVFWPVSKGLLDAVGWRHAFLAYAALHGLVCLPMRACAGSRRASRSRPSWSA